MTAKDIESISLEKLDLPLVNIEDLSFTEKIDYNGPGKEELSRFLHDENKDNLNLSYLNLVNENVEIIFETIRNAGKLGKLKYVDLYGNKKITGIKLPEGISLKKINITNTDLSYGKQLYKMVMSGTEIVGIGGVIEKALIEINGNHDVEQRNDELTDMERMEIIKQHNYLAGELYSMIVLNNNDNVMISSTFELIFNAKELPGNRYGDYSILFRV